MGMHQAFYFIDRKDLTDERIEKGLQETLQILKPLFTDRLILGSLRDPLDAAASVVQHPSFRWLPLYSQVLCDVLGGSTEETMKIAKAFQSPMLSVTIDDSDCMLLDYVDPMRSITHRYVKYVVDEELASAEPNAPDADFEQDAFPSALLACISPDQHDRLHEICRSTEYVFAEDIMRDLLPLLQTEEIYDVQALPEGYLVITKEAN